jgi:hypothetical protein
MRLPAVRHYRMFRFFADYTFTPVWLTIVFLWLYGAAPGPV